MNQETPEKGPLRGDGRSDPDRFCRGRHVAVEVLGVSIIFVVALGLSAWIAVQLDSVAVGGVIFIAVLLVAFVALSRRLNLSSTEWRDVDPKLAHRASQGIPRMHKLVEVPVYAGGLVALWVATWACKLDYSTGLAVFLGFMITVSKIVVARGLSFRYGLLVVVLFWCSAVVLWMWPTAGYPTEIGWRTMVAGPVIHVITQAIAYLGNIRPGAKETSDPGAQTSRTSDPG